MTLGNALMKMLVNFQRVNCLFHFVVFVALVVSSIDLGSCDVAEPYPLFTHNILFLYHGLISQRLTVKRRLRKSKAYFFLLYHLFPLSKFYRLARRLLKSARLHMQLVMRYKSCFTAIRDVVLL